jgi:hypothetical protein
MYLYYHPATDTEWGRLWVRIPEVGYVPEGFDLVPLPGPSGNHLRLDVTPDQQTTIIRQALQALPVLPRNLP